MVKEYSYEEINLIPNFCVVNSRNECNTEIQFGPRKFKLPIVPANMRSIIDEKLAIWLASNDYFYIMHRFGTDNLEFCKKMKDLGLYTSISIGVKKESYESLQNIYNAGIKPDYITLDIAHAFCLNAVSILQFVRHLFPNSFVIAGNVCEEKGVKFLEDNGADATKAGIGQGSSCTTRLQTGFTRPQFSTVLKCTEAAKKPVIADGGIVDNCDFAKALVSGATMIMAGGIFSGFSESAGNTIEINGIKYKEYYGSASEFNKGEKRHVEGKKILVPLKGSIVDKYTEITQALQSSISYAGGKDLSAFLNVKYVYQ